MITWVDIVITAFNDIEKETGNKKINIKDKNFVLKVCRIAYGEKKIQQPDIDRKINIIINSQGKENFEKIEKNTYCLANFIPDINLDDRFKKEMEEFKKILENLKQQGINETERLAIIKARIGQGLFRDKLFKKWNGCSVTGYKQKEMLIASHIKPWSESEDTERLNVDNGLLLTANLDKAFDRGFITFKDNGKIDISEDLAKPDRVSITEDLEIKNLSKGNKEYLNYHRDNIYLDREEKEENEAD